MSATEPNQGADHVVAAVDLGSNSFHMVVARHDGASLQVLDRLREPVRLAAGLGPDNHLDAEARDRAFACLERFGQRLRGVPSRDVRAVGTNTLRRARSGRRFLEQAGRLLGHEIEVVSGVEEARLIYLGVAHSVADDGLRRLVIDIGGGSTEMIVGEGHSPGPLMESLHMGCVSLTEKHFRGGNLDRKGFQRAEIDAGVELEPVEQAFREGGWRRTVGASGTIRAVAGVLRDNGWTDIGITLGGLERLRDALIGAGHVDRVSIRGLSARRAQVLPGGVAILLAVFRALDIERMEAAEGALREGVLHDLIGRFRAGDVRDGSVEGLARRYHVDMLQARRVAGSAQRLLDCVVPGWAPDDEQSRKLLAWAATLHEIGLDISHSQYHKHGAYVAANSDMAGFSREEQLLLALLVRSHRRKFRRSLFEELPPGWVLHAERLAVLLRLAVLWHRGRGDRSTPNPRLAAERRCLTLVLPAGWPARHPLLMADLEVEQAYLARAGYELQVTEAESRCSTPR